MNFIITPRYSDVFEGEIPKLEDLLIDFPSKAVLGILCLINAELYTGRDSEAQSKIFNFLTQRMQPKTKRQILTKLYHHKKQQRIDLFSIRFSLEFIHYELTHFRDFTIEDTTPEQEFNFLKAYLVIVDNVNDSYELSFDVPEEKGEFFQVATWPTFTDQYEANHPINPINSLTRSLVFFNVLKNLEEFKPYVTSFLNYQQKANYWDYLRTLSDALQLSWTNDKQVKLQPFYIPQNEYTKKIIDNFTINPAEYKKRFGENKQNFNGLKSFPVIKIDSERNVVTNWNYITNKFYEGLLFDFYGNSGIKDHPKFKSFPDFKNFVAQEITEKHIFKKTLSYYLDKKYAVLNFDESNDNGFPDAYYRIGNYIFLFEIKDAYFPSKVINSLDYDEIKGAIDTKYNTDRKGTGQIVKQLKALAVAPFEEKSYQQLKIKPRNLTIYPVIIYTDNFFSMPGVNRYLNQELRKRLDSENDLKTNFKTVKDLVFIDMSFLIGKIHELHKFNLKELAEGYFQYLKRYEKNFNKKYDEQDMFSMNLPFERYVSKIHSTKKNSSFLEKVFEVLEIEKDVT